MNICAQRRPIWVALIGLIVIPGAAGADQIVAQSSVSVQPRVRSSPPRSDFRVDSNMVLVPVSVTDLRNRAVTGLEREAFRVFEGNQEQKIIHFSSDDAPLSVGLVFDSSGSMADKLHQSRAAVAAFLKAANPDDEFFLVDFSDEAHLAVPFTRATGEIQDRLMVTGSSGKTALLDAVCMALQYMRTARYSRRALLVISDGGDNDSRYTEAEIGDLVRESDVWIYALGIYGRGQPILGEEELAGPRLLTKLAEQTGGRQFAVRYPNELPEIAAQVGLELRNQYILGYTPVSAQPDGKYRRVRVKLVERRDLHVSWRRGYYASAQ